MKRWSKVILAVGLVALLACTLLACGGGGGGAAASTPEETVRNFLSAHEAVDVHRAADCCTGDALEWVQAMGEPPAGVAIIMRVSNLRTEVASQTEDTATVEAYYNWYESLAGEEWQGPVHETYYLVNIDGRWYIEDWYEH